MVTQWRYPSHIGTIPNQGPITSTTSPNLTIHLQFFQLRRKKKQHFNGGKIMKYVQTPPKYRITVEPTANHIHCETTGNVLGYRDLVNKDAPVWKK